MDLGSTPGPASIFSQVMAPPAQVAKLVDARDLKSLDHCDRAGSIPALGTKNSPLVLLAYSLALFIGLRLPLPPLAPLTKFKEVGNVLIYIRQAFYPQILWITMWTKCCFALENTRVFGP